MVRMPRMHDHAGSAYWTNQTDDIKYKAFDSYICLVVTHLMASSSIAMFHARISTIQKITLHSQSLLTDGLAACLDGGDSFCTNSP